MSRSKAWRWLAGGIGLFLLGLILARSPIGLILLGSGALVLAATLAPLIYPWWGDRRQFRLRYHAPAGTSIPGAALARGLSNLAQHGAVAVIWRRAAGNLTCTIEIPARLESLLAGQLGRVLPDSNLEPSSDLPMLLTGRHGFYQWPFRATGQVGGAGDWASLLTDQVWVGDGEIRLHLLPAGGVCLLWGTPGPGAAAAGLRPMWRPGWRWTVPKPPSPTPPAVKRRVQLLRPTTSAPIPWLVRYFRHYPLADPWPGLDPPAWSLPATGEPGTSRLDTKTSLLVPLPAGYLFPLPVERALVLGMTTADRRAVGLPIRTAAGAAHPAWCRHLLVLGQTNAGRQTSVEALISQAIRAAVPVLHLDPIGEASRHMAGLLPVELRPRLVWADIENPAASLRVNLLAVPALGGLTAATGEATALLAAIEDHISLLGVYLAVLGVTASGGPGWAFVLDWARVLLLRHHRGRLVGDPDGPVAPDLRLLYELLTEADGLPAALTLETTAWTMPTPALESALESAGLVGVQAGDLARTTLAAISERLAPMSRADRRLLTAGLRDRLAPALDHPGFRRLFSGPLAVPMLLADQTPAPIILSRLPTIGVTAQDAAAARWYALYLYLAFAGAARDRLRVPGGGVGRPGLIVIENAPLWHASSLLAGQSRTLGAGGFACLTSAPRLPAGHVGDEMLTGAATWLIHTLDAPDVDRLRPQLQRLGVIADLPLAQLPAGVAVIKAPSPAGPVVTTAYTDLVHINQGRALAAGHAPSVTVSPPAFDADHEPLVSDPAVAAVS